MLALYRIFSDAQALDESEITISTTWPDWATRATLAVNNQSNNNATILLTATITGHTYNLINATIATITKTLYTPESHPNLKNSYPNCPITLTISGAGTGTATATLIFYRE